MGTMTAGPILAVEDNPDDLFLLESAIEMANLKGQVQIVRDGVEATDYLQGVGPYADRERFRKPSVVLLDLKLPKKSGLEVLAWMRDRPESERIPVIVLSVSNKEEDVRRAYDLGAFSYHVKSIGFNELFALLRDIDLCRTSLVECALDEIPPLPGARRPGKG